MYGLAVLIAAGGVVILLVTAISVVPSIADPAYKSMTMLGAVFAFLMLFGMAVVMRMLAAGLRRSSDGSSRLSTDDAPNPDNDSTSNLPALGVATRYADHSSATSPEHWAELHHGVAAMLAMLKEINENSLLDEAGRKAKLEILAQQQRRAVVIEVERLMRDHQWVRAKMLLESLSARQPGQKDVVEAMAKLEEQRKKMFDDELQKARKNVTDLIAISAWDKALERAEALQEQHPDQPACADLVARVCEQREHFRNEQIKRLSGEIQKCVQRKRWNDALQAAEQLVQKYPDSADAHAVESQMSTLTENAEIERRQQLEEQIRDLVQRHSFVQAEELAKHVIETYPSSPQAAALRERLPKLSELARQQEKEIQL
jgi:outer membrane protein assembly factor BamD (BamD/ComL family)